ncbi:MAG: hypothetical protein ABJA66_11485 [Actinomycetota bacterium]
MEKLILIENYETAPIIRAESEKSYIIYNFYKDKLLKHCEVNMKFLLLSLLIFDELTFHEDLWEFTQPSFFAKPTDLRLL